jgi:hypothetical protein
MYITQEDFQRGLCRNGHPITWDSYTTSTTAQGAKFYRCKQCRNESVQRWKENHPDEAKAKKLKAHLRQRYNITISRDDMLVAQGSVCAICERTGCHWGKGYKNVWHIDHAHDGTANHRGILCAACNTAFGQFKNCPLQLVAYMLKWLPNFSEQVFSLLRKEEPNVN